MSRDDAAEARTLFERAIELAPSGEFGTSDLAVVHFLEAYYRWSDSQAESLDRMLAAAERAVAADDNDPRALTILGWANGIAQRWDDALPPVERALEISPSFVPAIGMRGVILVSLARVETGIAAINEAIRLSPRDGFTAFWLMGLYWGHHMLGRHEEAARTAQQGIRIAPNNPTFRRQLAAAYALQGRMAEARAALQEYLRLEPNHTIADASKVPSRDEESLERFLEGLRLAGLPE